MDEKPQVGDRELQIVVRTSRHSKQLLAKAFARLAVDQADRTGRQTSEQDPESTPNSCKEACA